RRHPVVFALHAERNQDVLDATLGDLTLHQERNLTLHHHAEVARVLGLAELRLDVVEVEIEVVVPLHIGARMAERNAGDGDVVEAPSSPAGAGVAAPADPADDAASAPELDAGDRTEILEVELRQVALDSEALGFVKVERRFGGALRLAARDLGFGERDSFRA